MPSQSYREQEAEIINQEYEIFKASWISIEEYLRKQKAKKIDIELQEKERIQKIKKRLIQNINKTSIKLSCMSFIKPWSYTDEQEEEYWQQQYKRERENLNY